MHRHTDRHTHRVGCTDRQTDTITERDAPTNKQTHSQNGMHRQRLIEVTVTERIRQLRTIVYALNTGVVPHQHTDGTRRQNSSNKTRLEQTNVTGGHTNRKTRSLADELRSRVQFGTVHFSSGWYLRAREIPYALQPRLAKFPWRCLLKQFQC